MLNFKKIVSIILFLVIIIILVIFLRNNLINKNSEPDSLSMNPTYLNASKEIISQAEITADLRKKETLNYKVFLKKENNIFIKSNEIDSKFTIAIKNKDGNKIIEKEINASQTVSFSSEEGEGTLKITLSEGKHDIVIKINEDE